MSIIAAARSTLQRRPARLDGRGAASEKTRRVLRVPARANPMPAVTLIDNYDSFTFNLAHYLGALGAEVAVWRNDEISVADVLGGKPDAIVLSPGPATPDTAGICLDLIRAASASTPILGVCLGHQAIGQVFGGAVVRAPLPMHGKLSSISHNARGVFRGINGPFQATRYHSLIIERASAPVDLEITAETDDGVIMGVSHRSLPTYGVQFHPESILSEHGSLILRNFLDLARAFNGAARVH
jgi:anthranilate synthase component 2